MIFFDCHMILLGFQISNMKKVFFFKLKGLFKIGITKYISNFVHIMFV